MRLIATLIILAIIARGALANPLKDKEFVEHGACTLAEGYTIPCAKFQDKDNWYYGLPNDKGTIVIVKRIPKQYPHEQYNEWVAPELMDEYKAYEYAHSF